MAGTHCPWRKLRSVPRLRDVPLPCPSLPSLAPRALSAQRTLTRRQRGRVVNNSESAQRGVNQGYLCGLLHSHHAPLHRMGTQGAARQRRAHPLPPRCLPCGGVENRRGKRWPPSLLLPCPGRDCRRARSLSENRHWLPLCHHSGNLVPFSSFYLQSSLPPLAGFIVGQRRFSTNGGTIIVIVFLPAGFCWISDRAKEVFLKYF